MAENQGEKDILRLLGAQQAQQQDQLKSGLRDVAGLMHMHNEAMKAAGFNAVEAFALTAQYHREWARRIVNGGAQG